MRVIAVRLLAKVSVLSVLPRSACLAIRPCIQADADEAERAVASGVAGSVCSSNSEIRQASGAGKG